MENVGKHEYMENMNVKTWMFFSIWKKEGFHTHTDKKTKQKTKQKNDRTTLIFFLRYAKQTYFFYALGKKVLPQKHCLVLLGILFCFVFALLCVLAFIQLKIKETKKIFTNIIKFISA